MSKASDLLNSLKKSGKLVDATLLSNEDSPCVVHEWISTGCLALDAILGGGIPVGRLTEIYGSPSSGKTLVAGQIIAVAQNLGHMAAYCDTESAVSINMMEKLGVNVNDLIYAAPQTVEGVFAFLDELIDNRIKIAPDCGLVFVWDSVAATSSDQEMEKDYGNIGYLDQARIISQAMRKISSKIAKSRVAAIFLNQTRENIGVMFGPKETTFGGKAISFHASIRLELRLSAKLKASADKKAKIVGMNTIALVTKNKVAAPFQEAILPIYFGSGIDDAGASKLWLTDQGYIASSGSWKTLSLPGCDELRFQTPQWQSIYDENYDAISSAILSGTNVAQAGELYEETVD